MPLRVPPLGTLPPNCLPVTCPMRLLQPLSEEPTDWLLPNELGE